MVRTSLVAIFLLQCAICCAGGKGELLVVHASPHKQRANMNTLLFDALAGCGLSDQSFVLRDNLTDRDLARAKAVLLLCGGTRYALTPHEQELKTALVEYVRAGGGLVLVSGLEQMWSDNVLTEELLNAFGSGMLMESPKIPRNLKIKLGERGVEHSYTDRVFAPCNEGVSQILFHSEDCVGVLQGVVGYKATDSWRTVLSAGKDIGGEPFPERGVPYYDERRSARPVEGDFPIVGIRDFGRGRVAWCGINRNLFMADVKEADTALRMRQVLADGAPGGPKSDLKTFLCNLMTWTASGSVDAAKIPVLRSLAQSEAHLPSAPRLFRGVVGPRTTYSTGTSTPQEYVDRAKSLGHDFVVFLEEFERLSLDAFERLRAECTRLTDDSFTVYCGYTIEKADGNSMFVFSSEPVYPGRKFLTPDGRKFIARTGPRDASPELQFFYGALGFVNNLGFFRFHESPYALTDIRVCQSLAVETRVNGVTAETALDAFEVNNRNGQAFMPISLELMDDVRYLTAESHRLEIVADGVMSLRHRLLAHDLYSNYPKAGSFGRQAVTSGPSVEFDMPRGDMASTKARLYEPRLNRWPYQISVSSEKGVARVELWDGDECVRRWHGAGRKSFAQKGALANERQHHYWVKAWDAQGGLAVTRAIGSNSFLLREAQCGDRENQMLYSNQVRSDGEPPMIAKHGGDTCLPDKGPWNGRVRPVGFFVFDGKWGMGGDGGFDGSPEDHPQVRFNPSIAWGDEEPASLGWVREFVAGRAGGPHVVPHRVVAGPNALVGDRVLDGCFPLSQREVVHVWHSLFPVVPCPYAETTARCSLYLPKVDGIVPYQWEQTLRLKEPVPASPKGRPLVRFGNLMRSRCTVSCNAHLGGEVVSNAFAKTFAMARGDCIVLKDKVWGSMAVFALAPVSYYAGVFGAEYPDAIAPAGTAFPFRMTLVGMHRGVADPDAFADVIRMRYAEFVPDGGVILDLCAENGARVKHFGDLEALPGTLGVRLTGLTDNRSAVVALSDGRMRLVPVDKGTAYAALGIEESGEDVFLGHPLTCPVRDVGLYLSMTASGSWQVEVHNPTASQVRASVKSDSRIKCLSFDKVVDLPPYSSRTLAL